MKKIIFSTYDDINNPYYAGGGAQAIYEITKRLAHFFEITVITGNYRGAKNTNKEHVFYKRIGPPFLGPKFGQLVYSFLLPYYVKKESYDIWIESFTPPFSTSFLPLFSKKPIIGLVHMLPSEDMERKYKLPFQAIENAGLKIYKKFIVLSDVFERKIRKINKNAEISIIPNGIEKIIFTKKRTDEEYILFLGRLEFDQKGIDLLIDAYKKISTKINARLVIAGSGSARDTGLTEQKILQSGLQDRIHLMGRVSGTKKNMLLKNCSVVVVPSRFETFSTVALEAIAYGNPLVSFAIEGLGWIPTKCAIKVKPFDVQALSYAILRVLTDKKLSNSMTKADKVAVKQFAWNRVVKQYVDLFKAVLNKN